MNPLQRNWNWESECAESGHQRFWDKQDELRSDGKGNETVTGLSVIKQYVLDIAEGIETLANKKGAGRGAIFNRALITAATRFTEEGESYTDYNILAYLGLSTILKNLGKGKKKSGHPYTAIGTMALKIGRTLEEDAKYHKFERELPAYYFTVMKSMEEQQVSSYRHINKVLSKKYNDMGLTWTDWGEVTQTKIGAKIIEVILVLYPNLFFKAMIKKGSNKKVAVIDTTVEFDDWLADNEYAIGMANVYKVPTLVEPLAWTWEEDNYVGGYHHPQLRNNTPFIKTSRTKQHEAWLKDKPAEQHAKAINKLQKTGWKINSDLVAIVQEASNKGLFPKELPQREPFHVPAPDLPTGLKYDDMTDKQKEVLLEWKLLKKRIMTKDKIRQGKAISLASSMQLAHRLKSETFYFVYTCDFRGRIYCTSTSLSPQGTDSVKGLLKFAKGKVMGEAGLFWLAVNIANKFGYDKVTYEDRVQWVEDNEEAIKAVATDPLGEGYKFASEADKPFQFIAACIEWARSDYGNNPNTVGYLPIGLDGACNGLQHFSALLKDVVGATATNVAVTEQPEDIYQRVADVCLKRIKLLNDPMAAKWIQVGISRKCAKTPVMTLPYGATQQSARKYVLDYVLDNIEKFNCSDIEAKKYATWLTPHLWASISEVVIAARQGMDWLQSVTRSVLKHKPEQPVTWITPVGFPVYQPYVSYEEIRINTQIGGALKLNLRGRPTSIDGTGQSSGIAPNYVHSLDNAHMVKTINSMSNSSLAMIHDDYGTHAADTELLFKRIREQFVDLYNDSNHLQDWVDQQNIEDYKALPEIGNFDVKDVLKSEYFFG